MKISGRVDGSVCGAVLSNRSSTTFRRAATTGRRQLCGASDKIIRDTQASQKKTRSEPSGSCPRSSQWLGSTFFPKGATKPSFWIPRKRDISFTYSTTAAAASVASANYTTNTPPAVAQMPMPDKQKLLSYVPCEVDGGTVQEHLDYFRDPYRRGYAQPDGPTLQVSEAKEDVEYPSKDNLSAADAELRKTHSRICGAISFRLRHPNRINLETIYDHYSKLPEPRMLHFSWRWRDKLLRVMGKLKKRDVESMLRYFSLISDVKSAGLTLRVTQWNFALAFATQFARSGAQEMESALRLWKRMEHESLSKANDVTFNILFATASKVGNFDLADLIFKEMDKRGIEFNRFHHVSIIHYFGLKLDSSGIRAAYKDMVESGEVIDSVALNCVIAGFLRCGEVDAAEQTYQRMRQGNPYASQIPEQDYRMDKVTTKVFMMFSRLRKARHPQLLQHSLQSKMWLTPDLRTYKLFIEYFGITMGDLSKVAQYLDEMKYLNITIHPTIFLALLKGFYVHGGQQDTDWTKERLDGVLKALYEARDKRVPGFRIDSWLVIWALRAVRKCSTSEAVLQTFDDLESRWDIEPHRRAFITDLLNNILLNMDLTSRHNTGETLHRSFKPGTRQLPCTNIIS